MVEIKYLVCRLRHFTHLFIDLIVLTTTGKISVPFPHDGHVSLEVKYQVCKCVEECFYVPDTPPISNEITKSGMTDTGNIAVTTQTLVYNPL